MWIWLIFILIIFGTLSFFAFEPIITWRNHKIPGPKSQPFWGNLSEVIATDLPLFINECYLKYGDIFKFWWGSTPRIVIGDLTRARRLTCRLLSRPSMRPLAMLSGDLDKITSAGLLNMSRGRWRAARKAFEVAVMHHRAVGTHADVMDECVRRLIGRLQQLIEKHGDTEMDISSLMGDLTMDVVGSAAFGVTFNTQDQSDGSTTIKLEQGMELPYSGHELVSACQTVFSQSSLNSSSTYVILGALFHSLSGLLRWLATKVPDAAHQRGVRARQVIIETGRVLVEHWKREREQSRRVDGDHKPVKTSDIRQHSFLSMLLEGREGDEGSGLTDAEVLGQMFTFLLAGFETTAVTLKFTIHLLSLHPEIQERAAQEALGAGSAALPGTEELARVVPYISAIIDEALRLYPPGASLLRTPDEDMMLSGSRIPAGGWLIFPLFSYHRDPKLWREPLRFVPERHLKSGADLPGQGVSEELHDGPPWFNPQAYMPFGSGARSCPGQRFALQEARIALTRLLQSFQFELGPSQEVPIQVRTGITMGPTHGVFVRVRPRRGASQVAAG